ncbi:MAG: cytochrome c maturation protein CcmE [Ignavibacteria bacterium]|nr:cytochrome c maturation protein CcmE [Ignavibacteria bacterium]
MKKYILIAFATIIFLILILVSFNKSAIVYTDFQNAKKLGKRVQVVGSWIKEMPIRYDINSSKFEFYMKDKKGEVMFVSHNGAQPNNFTIAPEIVVQGFVKDTTFVASQIITKCPSKYEGEVEHLKYGGEIVR